MKTTTENEKLIFDALVRANISFIDGERDNGAARFDFLLGEPASGVHLDVVDVPETNRHDVIRIHGAKAVAFFADLLAQRHEIERLRRQIAENEVMLLAQDNQMRAGSGYAVPMAMQAPDR